MHRGAVKGKRWGCHSLGEVKGRGISWKHGGHRAIRGRRPQLQGLPQSTSSKVNLDEGIESDTAADTEHIAGDAGIPGVELPVTVMERGSDLTTSVAETAARASRAKRVCFMTIPYRIARRLGSAKLSGICAASTSERIIRQQAFSLTV